MSSEVELSKQFPLNHLAIAVEDLAVATPVYLALGFTADEPEIVATQQVRVQKFRKGEFCIELLEAHPEGSGPVGKFIAKKGQGLHHVALTVADLNATLARLTSKGVGCLSGYPQPGANGHTVAFLDPKTTGGVLYELVQQNAV